ncbi:MAG: hypothetical protein P8R46_02730 [Planctomycetota bacterium]|nr:hypothetical protein [Planctomycetota bacterium]
MGPAVWTESAGRAARPRTLELYDLHTDPHELNDLLLSSPGPTAHALRDRLQALIPRFP